MPKVGFGSQIRNYFLHPDQRVKDARTGFPVGSFHSVLDGNIQGFLDAYLRFRAGKGKGPGTRGQGPGIGKAPGLRWGANRQ